MYRSNPEEELMSSHDALRLKVTFIKIFVTSSFCLGARSSNTRTWRPLCESEKWKSFAKLPLAIYTSPVFQNKPCGTYCRLLRFVVSLDVVCPTGQPILKNMYVTPKNFGVASDDLRQLLAYFAQLLACPIVGVA